MLLSKSVCGIEPERPVQLLNVRSKFVALVQFANKFAGIEPDNPLQESKVQ